jgi:hypothetical protein
MRLAHHHRTADHVLHGQELMIIRCPTCFRVERVVVSDTRSHT